MSTRRTLLRGMGLLLLGGCTAMMSGASTPVERRLTVPDAPAQAEAKALRTTLGLGGELLRTPQAGALQAKVHNAVILTVLVEPEGRGSTVTVSGRLLPNKVAFGSLTEVDDWVAAYQRQQ